MPVAQPDKTGKIQKKNTKFQKGRSGNPKGRPRDSFSLTTILKRKLQEIPKGEKRTYAEIIIDRLIEGACKGGDSQIKAILTYTEGVPKQKVEVPDPVKVIPILGGASLTSKQIDE